MRFQWPQRPLPDPWARTGTQSLDLGLLVLLSSRGLTLLSPAASELLGSLTWPPGAAFVRDSLHVPSAHLAWASASEPDSYTHSAVARDQTRPIFALPHRGSSDERDRVGPVEQPGRATAGPPSTLRATGVLEGQVEGLPGHSAGLC